VSAGDTLNIRRELERGLVRCLVCGRSGGHLVAGDRICSLCRPTPLRRWLAAVGFTVAELAVAARVSRDTVQVALRGERISARAARALAAVTKIPVDQLRVARAKESDEAQD